MTTTRFDHTATLLANGEVLIVGGICNACRNANIRPETSAEIYRPVALVPAPILLSLSGDGSGQGAILHANTARVASANDPAVAGEYLEIYLTGLPDGGVIPPQISIGGKWAQVTYFGKSAYTGVNQANLRVPSGISPGPALPVWLMYIARPSNQVTIGLR
jgi:uncharacterized protein (TIGR03437 family)